MYEIKNIRPLPLGKSLALIGSTVFLSSFAIFISFMMVIDEMDLDDLFDEEIFYVLGGGMLVSGVGFFVGGLLGAMVYNYISERFGGIKMDIEYSEEDFVDSESQK